MKKNIVFINNQNPSPGSQYSINSWDFWILSLIHHHQTFLILLIISYVGYFIIVVTIGY